MVWWYSIEGCLCGSVADCDVNLDVVDSAFPNLHDLSRGVSRRGQSIMILMLRQVPKQA